MAITLKLVVVLLISVVCNALPYLRKGRLKKHSTERGLQVLLLLRSAVIYLINLIHFML